MAYLSSKGFDYDIFISYSHIDNDETEGSNPNGWVSLFHKELETSLKKMLIRPKDLKIWRDSYLRSLDVFDNKIEEAIKRSAIFITFTSYPYIGSEYCRKEIKIFYDAATNPQNEIGVVVNNMSRIVNVRLSNIQPVEWLKECEGRTGYKMFLENSADVNDIGINIDPTNPQFKSVVSSLAVDIRKLLIEIEKFEKVKTTKIFFANVAKSLFEIKQRIIADLQSQNKELEIITAVPPPEEEHEHENKVNQVLNKVSLSVHLFNDAPGKDINGKDTYPQKQAELALTSGTPHIFWIPKNLKLTPDEVENNHHRSFLNKIESGEYIKKNTSFIRSSDAELTREIVNKLREISLANTTASAADAQQNYPVVLLDTHPKDLNFAEPMIEYFAKKNIITELSLQAENKGISLTQLEKKLAEVSSFLIVIGISPQAALSRLETCFQLMFAKKYRIKARGIYLSPCHINNIDSNLKNDISFYEDNNFQILDDSQQQCFNPNTFDAFIQKVVGVKGGVQ